MANINVNGLQTFTDSDMVTLFRWAIAQLALSESVEIEGRRITRAQLPALRDTLQFFEERVYDAQYAQAGGNVAVAGFGDPAYTVDVVNTGTSN